jgi:ADP-ribosyl-[dinitrogen reductase] hydrolase
MESEHRVVGGVLGLALGDALGAPFESRRARDVPDPIPALELPWLDRSPGSTTDETAMARNLWRSLADRGGFDPRDVVRRHLDWFASDPPDVGSITRHVLVRVAAGQEPTEAARAVWEERGPEVSAGNGSVGYCAPLGLAYAFRPSELVDLAPRLSALTHHDARCRTSVLAVTLAAAALVRGEPGPRAAEVALASVLDREGGEELEFLAEQVGRARPIDGPDRGFCLFTAGVALQALVRFDDFETGLRHVVGLGGDADANGAVAGALLGAHVGIEGLPADWVRRLREADAIREDADTLVPLAVRGGS